MPNKDKNLGRTYLTFKERTQMQKIHAKLQKDYQFQFESHEFKPLKTPKKVLTKEEKLKLEYQQEKER